MKINTGENVEGIPILKIRDFLRKSYEFNPEYAAYLLKVEEPQAQKVLKALTTLGYLEELKDDTNTHRTTIKGNALAMSKGLPSITKEKAEKLFSEFMDRVKKVNENESLMYRVTQVVLFGSYITDAPSVNDINIAVKLDRKEHDKELYMAKHEVYVQEAEERGVTFKSFFDRLVYPEIEVHKLLKSKSRYLSFHPIDDSILKEVKTQEVYL